MSTYLFVFITFLPPILCPPTLPCTDLHCPIAALSVQVHSGQTSSVCTFCLEVRGEYNTEEMIYCRYCLHNMRLNRLIASATEFLRSQRFNLWLEAHGGLHKSSRSSDNHTFSSNVTCNKSRNEWRSGKAGLNTGNILLEYLTLYYGLNLWYALTYTDN